MVFIRSTLIASALTLMLSVADAHVTLNPKFVEPNQKNLTTAFRVPHGCGNYSTTAIQATVPENFPDITPQEVANWTLAIEYTDSSNKSIKTISWSGGKLGPHDPLDFPLVVDIPNADLSSQPNVTYYFPVVQTCEVGISNWTAIPGVNANGETSPSLVVVKNATQAAADALAIKNNSTSSHGAASSSAAGAKPSAAPNAGNSLYAGLLPVAAAVAAAVVAL